MHAEDVARIRHMVDAAETVGQFMFGRKRADLDSDRMLLFAVVRAIEVVGEAAGKVSEETRATSQDIPWGAIVSMRNRLIHGYFDIVSKTVSKELPDLLPRLQRLAGKP